jgi:hypothetical protein
LDRARDQVFVRVGSTCSASAATMRIQAVQRARHLFLNIVGRHRSPCPIRMGGMHRRHHERTAGQSNGSAISRLRAVSRNPVSREGFHARPWFRPGSTSLKGNPLVTLPIGINAPFTPKPITQRSVHPSSAPNRPLPRPAPLSSHQGSALRLQWPPGRRDRKDAVVEHLTLWQRAPSP